MPKITYVPKAFRADTLALIDVCGAICSQYSAEGYELTLRGLYYQLVTRNVIANTVQEYGRLKTVVSDARLAGLIDWDHITDATRNLRDLAHWRSPQDILGAIAQQYRTFRWDNQLWRPEVWIEKDAMVGVIAGTCRGLDVPYFSCRGYTSQSEMWAAAQRHLEYEDQDQYVIVLHLGDHDPSGLDMTRDIRERLELFGARTRVKRIALNMDQIETYGPPPNPAKLTDARARAYVDEFHDPEIDEPGQARSWELDALAPDVIAALITAEVEAVRDDDQWAADTGPMVRDRALLAATRDQWDGVVGYLNGDE